MARSFHIPFRFNKLGGWYYISSLATQAHQHIVLWRCLFEPDAGRHETQGQYFVHRLKVQTPNELTS